MVSLQTLQPTSKLIEPSSSPARISFSSDFLNEDDFISICPNQSKEPGRDRNPRNVSDFEFLSGSSSNMITADELISEGKLLPFSQTHNVEKLKNISLKTEEKTKNDKEEPRISWFLDDDPSPRPPTCTVLWKELLKLRKHRCSSTLSPSSSSSSSSSRNSTGEMSSDDKKGNAVKIKKGLDRTRSGSLRIRPVINLPICSTHGKNSSLPLLFPIRRVKLERL